MDRQQQFSYHYPKLFVNNNLHSSISERHYLTYRFRIFGNEDMRVFEFFSFTFSGALSKGLSATPRTGFKVGSPT